MNLCCIAIEDHRACFFQEQADLPYIPQHTSIVTQVQVGQDANGFWKWRSVHFGSRSKSRGAGIEGKAEWARFVTRLR